MWKRRQLCERHEHVGPVYLRFDVLAVPVINDNPEYKFEIGKGVELRKGKDTTIVATGLCVSETLKSSRNLAAKWYRRTGHQYSYDQNR